MENSIQMNSTSFISIKCISNSVWLLNLDYNNLLQLRKINTFNKFVFFFNPRFYRLLDLFVSSRSLSERLALYVR